MPKNAVTTTLQVSEEKVPILPLLLRVTAGQATKREARAPSQTGVHQVHPRGNLHHGPNIHGGNSFLDLAEGDLGLPSPPASQNSKRCVQTMSNYLQIETIWVRSKSRCTESRTRGV